MTFTTILFILVVAAYVAANIILAYVAININGNDTVSDILNEQDFGLGKVGVIFMYWPALIVIYLRSLRPINTEFSFDELNEEVK